MQNDQPQTPATHSAFAVGMISVLLMLGGAYLAFTDDIALGAALIAIGAAITPSVAWWRRRSGDGETPEP